MKNCEFFVRGNLNKVNSIISQPIGTSNIIPKELNFELSSFRNLKKLIILEISTENIYDCGTIRKTLEHLIVHHTTIDEINKILLCDDIHKSEMRIFDTQKVGFIIAMFFFSAKTQTINLFQSWLKLREANFSYNELSSIDITMNLLPKLEKLTLDQNQIETIKNLDKLSSLSSLSLCENKISQCIDWHLELGNLITLNLSLNQIKSLIGFRKMYSLVNLDISCNLIENVDEVDHIANLPCLENLRLTGNPVAGTVDYRSRVLARFDNRSSEIFLDNEKGNQQEIDTALVLSALRISKRKSVLIQMSGASGTGSTAQNHVDHISFDR